VRMRITAVALMWLVRTAMDATVRPTRRGL